MSTQEKHTPGSWHTTKVIEDDERVFNICAPNGCPVAVARRCGPEDAHNARLIAAAPELLEALQAFVRYAEDCNDDSLELDRAHAAIAKAIGGAP